MVHYAFPDLRGLIVYALIILIAAALIPTLLHRSRFWLLPYLLLCLYGWGQCFGAFRNGLTIRAYVFSHLSLFYPHDAAYSSQSWNNWFVRGILFGIILAGAVLWPSIKIWRMRLAA